MPGGGDGVACPATSPDKGRWVPHPVALARQRAQEAGRHAPASPLVAIVETPPPKPDGALPRGEGVGAQPQRSLLEVKEAPLATGTLGERAPRRSPSSRVRAL
jgi:hypothetical protein